MTGSITNLTTGDTRRYASVKERRLIIRAWDRQGACGVQIRPDVLVRVGGELSDQLTYQQVKERDMRRKEYEENTI